MFLRRPRSKVGPAPSGTGPPRCSGDRAGRLPCSRSPRRARPRRGRERRSAPSDRPVARRRARLPACWAALTERPRETRPHLTRDPPRSKTDPSGTRAKIGLRGGVAPARAYIPELLPDVLEDRINESGPPVRRQNELLAQGRDSLELALLVFVSQILPDSDAEAPDREDRAYSGGNDESGAGRDE